MEEDLDSLCSFLRSEATTLEMTAGVNAINVNNINNLESSETSCEGGCESVHSVVDCSVYNGMTSDRRRAVIRSSQRCFLCLEKGHKKDQCTQSPSCSCEDKHHISLCTAPIENPQVSNCCATATEIGEEIKPRDYSPMVIAEVCNKHGEWKRAKCFLDGGSNQSLCEVSLHAAMS